MVFLGYSAAQSTTISKRRKFVADGVFYAELNEFFTRELAEEGYSGVEVRVTPTVTDISTFRRTGFFEFESRSKMEEIQQKLRELTM
jgi:ribosomal protein S3